MMPLHRFDDAYSAEMHGVRFRMADDRDTLIVYTVSHEALSDYGAAHGMSAANDDAEIFLRFRTKIERAASQKFDAGNPDRTISNHELMALR